MSELFLKILNMSIAASWLVLVVLLLRLVLKRAPKWIIVLLWGFVAIRLVCPFSFESGLSLIPSAEPVSPEIIMETMPEVHTGYESLNSAVNPVISQSFTPEPGASVNPLQIWIWLAAVIWLVGIVVMLIYTVISYFLLRRKVATAVRLRNNIFQSENVASPFVLGIIKPKIYLPFRIDEGNLAHVVAHEESHIRRKDHWWKPFGFVLLALHWFNPLMWLGYILLCRDIELACDEKVIKQMDNEAKADYTQALVACSVNRRSIAACPLAFGEVGVKERVKSVMNYRKPAFWIILAAILTCVAVAVCFLTNPNTTVNDQLSVFIDCQIANHFHTEQSEGNACCVNWEVLGTRKRGRVTTVYMWVLYEEYSMNNGELYEETGSHIPTVITVKHGDGQYKLIEYWEPRDGTYLVSDIREKFPWRLQRKALDSQRYIQKQQAENQGMALAYFQTQSNLDEASKPSDTVITNNNGILSGGNAGEILSLDDLIIIDNSTGEIIYGGNTKGPLSFDYGFIMQNDRGEIVYIGNATESLSLDDHLIIIDNKTGQILYSGKNGIKVTETISTGLRTYYKMSDGTWIADGHKYQYRLEISGRMPNAAVDSTFVYLSNLKSISFARAWRAAGLSSSMEDYFSPEEAVLVDWISGDNSAGTVEGVNDYVIKTDRLNGAIAEAILSHHKSEKPDGLLNTESHMILVNEVVSGTPLVGQTGHIREETVYVYYLNLRFNIQGDRPEEHNGIYGQAAITFTVGEDGIYTVKHFIKPESSVDAGADYDAELISKFVSASEDIAENEEKYNKQLLDGCWKNATEYMEHLKAQSSAQPGGTTSIPDNHIPDPSTGEENLQNVPTDGSANVDVPSEDSSDVTAGCQLIVTGRSLAKGKCMEFCDTTPRYALVPFTAVIQELGAQIEWQTDTVAQIWLNGKAYTLNTQEVSLLEAGSDFNRIIPTPGGKLHSRAIKHELLLDHITVETVALMMGITIKVEVDYLNQIVVVDYP